MTSKVCRISLKGVFLLLLALTFLCCKLSGRKEEIFRKAVRGDSSRSVGTQWREKQRQKRNKIKNKSKVLQTTRSIMEYNRQCQLKIEKESNVKNVSINALLFFENFDHLPYPMKPYEGLTSPCSFSMADCQMEIIEHQLVETFIKPEDGVVEFGGRFGTTSCAIAARQKNSGKLLVVEPDSSVWYILEENRRRHNCGFWTLRGVVSASVAMNIFPGSYATRTLPRFSSRNKVVQQDAFSNAVSFETLKSIVPFSFQVLLFDCEGCIESVFFNKTLSEIKNSLEHTRLIIIEGDMSISDPSCQIDCVDYVKWLQKFETLGFSLKYQQQDKYFHHIYHFVLGRDPKSG